MERFKKVFGIFFSSALIAPLILITIYLAVFFLIRGTTLTPAQVISHFSSLYARYGYEIIFLGALMESLVVINFFVPGATILVLGAVFAHTGQVHIVYAILAATAGSLFGFVIDYLLGYFGFSAIINKLGYSDTLQKAKHQLNNSAVKSFALGFIHPNIGSFVSLAAGVTKISMTNFVVLALFSTLFWTSLWGFLIFSFGKVFLVVLTKYTTVLVIGILSVWVLLALYQKRK